MKTPGEMTAGQINKELDRLDQKNSSINDELIEAGRGHETANETWKKDDELSMRWRRIADRRLDLKNEISQRYGPGSPRRLPKGFGPRRLGLIRMEKGVSPATKIPKVLGWALGGIVAGGVIYLMTRGPKRVRGREFAQGVHPALIGLLDLWDKEGWFNVTVAPPFVLPSGYAVEGGLRTDEAAQRAIAQAGLSKAFDLKSTAHGRGAALDIHPEGFDPHRDFSTQPEMAGLMAQFASWASQKVIDGVEFYPGINFGDYPHIEIKGWRSLPFPMVYA